MATSRKKRVYSKKLKVYYQVRKRQRTLLASQRER